MTFAQISFDSPIGWITIQAEGEKITSLTMSHKDSNLGTSKILTEAKKQVLAYLFGKLTKFDLPVHLEGTEFQKAVWKVIAKTGFGKTVTYGDIGEKIGKPLAARAIGGAVGANPVPLIIGCHRVLGSNKKITGYSGGEGIPTKEWLLDLEGIEYK
jgi:methylated-DNA-[protein]-cysteine S-methyltransferase